MAKKNTDLIDEQEYDKVAKTSHANIYTDQHISSMK